VGAVSVILVIAFGLVLALEPSLLLPSTVANKEENQSLLAQYGRLIGLLLLGQGGACAVALQTASFSYFGDSTQQPSRSLAVHNINDNHTFCFRLVHCLTGWIGLVILVLGLIQHPSVLGCLVGGATLLLFSCLGLLLTTKSDCQQQRVRIVGAEEEGLLTEPLLREGDNFV